MGTVLVLCYHAIGEDWGASVAPERLRQQVELLLRRGYQPVTFTDVVTQGSAGRRLAVTFDDAYASVLERAHPVLEALGAPATVFAVSSFAASGGILDWPGLVESGVGENRNARRSLAWADLRSLADAGWEIGSHTRTHPMLTQIGDTALADELVTSRAELEQHLGRPCTSIAYPFGDVDERVVRATREAGYVAACSLSVATSGPLAWPRVGVYGKDTPLRFRLKVSPSLLRLRARTHQGSAAVRVSDRAPSV